MDNLENEKEFNLYSIVLLFHHCFCTILSKLEVTQMNNMANVSIFFVRSSQLFTLSEIAALYSSKESRCIC